STQIFNYIKDMIKTGKLQPGDKLPTEAVLTETFNVSRTPVREALSALETNGFIKSIRGGRSVIQDNTSLEGLLEVPALERVDINQIIYLLEVRIILESEAAMLSGIRRTDRDLIEIKK